MSEVIEPTTPVKPESINDLKPKMKLNGIVTRLELYGAFIDLGIGTNALIHISQLGTEHVNRVSDVLSEGQEVTVWVDKVDPKSNQVMVTMIEPLAVEWRDLEKGQVYTGIVTRLENFGVFVDIGAEREGLVHISELSHEYVNQPSEAVSVGDEVKVMVLGSNKRKRRIDLSIKALLEKPGSHEPAIEEFEAAGLEEDDFEEVPTAMEFALRQALGDDFPAPSNSKKRKSGKKRRRNRDKMREQQDDILERTLRVSDN
jgi:small subunit ribosomal protein S1